MREEVLRLAGPVYTLEEQPGAYVRRLEAACQLLHQGLLPSEATCAQPISSRPAAHNATPAGVPPTPSAAGNTTAVELCTLLLTDQEVLDVVLALHDIRTAQLRKLMPWPGHHALILPMLSKGLAQHLSQSQRSVPGSQLLSFVQSLGRDYLPEDDPLLYVWDSMHRTMLLVLAAMQSLPIRPHPQHPDPAASTHTSTTTQLPPGYHHCSACLLLTLRMAICLAQHCVGNALEGSQTMAQLHATLPGLLLGLSTAVSVMQAAGHPEAQAQRVLLTRLLLFLGALVLVVKSKAETRPEDDIDTWLAKEVTTSCPEHLARLLARSPAVTGWPGPLPDKLSPMDISSTAGGSSSKGGGSSKRRKNYRILDPASWNSFAHVAQALCAVLGRQEEGLIMDQLISTCKAEGGDSFVQLQQDILRYAEEALYLTTLELSHVRYMDCLLNAANASSRSKTGALTALATASLSPLVSGILGVLPRCLAVYQNAAAVVRLAATVGVDRASFKDVLDASLSGIVGMTGCLYLIQVQLMKLLPDWRRRQDIVRAALRTASAGAHMHNSLSLLTLPPKYEDVTSSRGSKPRSIPPLMNRTPALDEAFKGAMRGLSDLWLRVLTGAKAEIKALHLARTLMQEQLVPPVLLPEEASLRPPSAQQLAPLTLDLVWGMEGMMQMMHHHQRMSLRQPSQEVNIQRWLTGTQCETLQQLCTGTRVLLVLFGHVIEVLAEPAAVGPAGLAAQPASWLPCGNSLVEGWCTRLLARVCQLLCITSPSVPSVPTPMVLLVCIELINMYKHLLDGVHQAPPSMSPEAERLLACVVMVVTVVVPLDLCVADVQPLPTVREAPCCMESSRDAAVYKFLTRVEPEQVWGWQALAAGTPAEASLASVLQGAANKLQLPHLVTPAPQGWQPGRLTLDMGRASPELLVLCFKCFLPLQYLDSLEEELIRILS